MMKRLTTLTIAVAVMFMIVAEAQAYTFTTLDVPGASYTYALDINDSGNVVGYSSLQSFVYDSSTDTYTTLAVPEAKYTYAYGINDSGIVVGCYYDSSWKLQGFIYDGSTDIYTTLVVPGAWGAKSTYPYGINDSGTVVGYYADGSWNMYSFIYDGTAYTTLDVPGASRTLSLGINDSGDIAGEYRDSSGHHGFIYDGSTDIYTTRDYPDASSTYAYGINDSGDVAGDYGDSSDYHGFIYDGSTDTYTTLDYPEAGRTYVRGINDSGNVVGYYRDSSRDYHGFIATAEEGDPTWIPDTLEINIDIKPQSCPNPLNIKSKGVLPVAIIGIPAEFGTLPFDVRTIDVKTVRLNGVEPIKTGFDDVARPSVLEHCDCADYGPDSFEDLVLKFDSQEIIATLGAVQDGDIRELTLTGNLLDGTAIEGLDCVVIKGKKTVKDCVTPPSGLVSWWDGDSVDDTTAFDIWDGNDGVIVGASIVPGIVGDAFSFDGFDDYIKVGTGPNLIGYSQVTLAAWVNSSQTSGSGCSRIIEIGSDYLDSTALVLDTDCEGLIGDVRAWVHTNGARRGGTTTRGDGINYNDGQWHYLAFTWDGADTRLYVDGVLKNMGLATGTIDSPAGTLIGQHNFAWPGGHTFGGLIDEVQVFGSALSASEIQAIFNAGSAGMCKIKGDDDDSSSSDDESSDADSSSDDDDGSE